MSDNAPIVGETTPSRSSRIASLLLDERVRFILAGGFNTVFGYGLFALVQFVVGRNITYFGSVIAAHAIGSGVAFVLYRRFVFRVRGKFIVDFFRFQSVYIVPLVANLLLLPVLVAGLEWNVYLSQALIVIVSTVISFLGHKYFSFRRASASPVQDSGESAATAHPRDMK